MDVLHICAGWQKWNGAANIARMIMDEQRREGHEVSFAIWAKVRELRAADEVWIHCGWLPCLWWAALWGRNVRWMPEACYDPVRLRYHGWKKWLVGPIERFCLRRAKALVATCEAEAEWIRAYLGRRCPPIEVTDIKRFFKLESGKISRVERVERVEGAGGDSRVERVERVEGEGFDSRVERVDRVEERGSVGRVEHVDRVEGEGFDSRVERVDRVEEAGGDNRVDGKSGGVVSGGVGELSRVERVDRVESGELHLLYLGRRHPLKGVEYLEKAVAELNSNPVNPENPVQNSSARSTRSTRLKIISNAFGEELEKVWDWCDVLVLPTLSDNFGLVIAEALERGKRVITTDGAPAWDCECKVESEKCKVGDAGSIWHGYGSRLIYLKGYRDGSPEKRVALLRDALKTLMP